MTVKYTMEFDSDEQAECFFTWLCGSEQQFWESCALDPEARPAVTFDYHNTKVGPDGVKRYGEFLENRRVICKSLESEESDESD